MKKFDWKKTIRINIMMLRILGLWPEGDATYRANFYTLYTMIVMIVFIVGHNFFQIINLFFILDDLQAVTGTIFVVLADLVAVLKAYYVMQNMGLLKKLMITLNSVIFQPKNSKQIILITPNLNFWKLSYVAYWTPASLTLIFWATFPILDKTTKEFRLPFLAWYPYNIKMSPLYEITYIYQIISVYLIAFININVDELISALNMYIGAQCDLLCDNLRNLFDVDYDKASNDINGKLINCVKHHREIVSFAENSNKFFNWIVLTQFFSSAVTIGLTMFQLTVVEPFNSEFYSLIFFGNSMSIEIFIYCWFGNEVEIKSSNIPYALFESDWTDASPEVKKKIIFFTLRCQKPIKMSALNLFYLTLDTFVRIFRTAWSYFAMLHQVNAKE